MTDKAKFLAGYLRVAYAESAPAKIRFLEAADLIESLSAELERVEVVAAQARGLECERDQLKARLEHFEFERDAAVNDLRKVCQVTEVCFCCKSHNTDYTEYVSNDCMDCIKHCNWQWRGVKEG